ncbi:MAG TPA: DUF6603 domain-containing protein [Acidimicrobiales bacterium]|jgi:hypothetical protein|nr:DUF6603 domain-containing protein [Acidimicrobiales bacterium]
MALTFDQLHQLLSPVAGKIRVAGDQLATPAAGSILAAFFADATLTLDDAHATADPARGTVTVTGNLPAGITLGLTAARVTSGLFTLLAEGTVTVAVDIAVNDPTWTLASSFPTLQGTLLESCSYAAASFRLDSTSPVVLPPDFRSRFAYRPDVPVIASSLVAGLSFQADITFGSDIGGILSELFETPVRAAGPIAVHFAQATTDSPDVADLRANELPPKAVPGDRPAQLVAYPQLLLTTIGAVGKTLTLGDYHLTAGLQLAGLLQEFPSDDGTNVGLVPVALAAITTEFHVDGIASIPINAYLYRGGDLVFHAAEGLHISLNKNRLPDFLNGTDLGDLLEPGQQFPAFSDVTIEAISLTVGSAPLSLKSISLSVALVAEDWPLLNGLVTITGIGFQFSVVKSADGFSPQGEIHAHAYLAGNKSVTLDAQISLPGLSFVCSLAEQVPIDLTAAVKNLIGDSIPLPTITGSTFTIFGNLTTSTYTFEALVKEDWTIVGTTQKGLTLQNTRVKLSSSGGTVTGVVSATVALAGVLLSLAADYHSGDQGWVFSGSTGEAGIKLSALLADLTELFSLPDLLDLPEVDLKQFFVEYHTSGPELSVVALVDIPDASLDLTNLPLLGPHLDPGDHLALGQVAFTLHKTTSGTTATLTFDVTFGDHHKEVVIPVLSRPKTTPAANAGGEATGPETTTGRLEELTGDQVSGPTDGSGVWLPVQRAFGPITVQRIGFTLGAAGVGVQLDASLSLPVLVFDILGLGITIPLTTHSAPSFQIHGLNVSFHAGVVTIDGGLLKVDNDKYLQFDGELVVTAETFSLTAFGSYATSEPPSFFVFALVNAPIGGPPSFFVTGVSGGLGFNRDLMLPSIDKVADFPLVAAANAQTNRFGTAPTLKDFLRGMNGFMGVSIGENWIAAGINFTSYEIVKSYALVTLAVGTRIQVGLLGMATIAVPPDDPNPVAQAQLALEAIFSPIDGVFSMSAQLTAASYILSKDCLLTGGFAFYIWFPPSPHAGDFVVTLGGYNPHFKPPTHYPTVPRLGINWTVRDTPLVVKGGLYLALTPQLVMAGGFLDATWNSGPIQAWFKVYADFLIQWKPFHYDIWAGVNFGVEARVELAFVTVTISVSVSANLHLWGPDFCGVADIDLSVISFSISFGTGSSSDSPPPLCWEEFKKSFLPGPVQPPAPAVPAGATVTHAAEATVTDTVVVTATLPTGLLRDLTTRHENVQYVVDPQCFSLRTQTLIPAKEVTLNRTPVDDGGPTRNTDFGVGPMALEPANFSSILAVCVTKDTYQYDHMTASMVLASAAKGLWLHDNDLAGSLNLAGRIDATVAGVVLQPPVMVLDRSLLIGVAILLYEKEASETWAWGANVAPTSDPYGHDDRWITLTSTVADPVVALRRSAVVTDLIGRGFSVSNVIETAVLTDRDRLGLLDAPVLHLLGENTAA